jgi:hypothetical protein
MPPWANELARLLIGVALFGVSLGFISVIWKISWALRGYVVTEQTRAETTQELVKLVREFMEDQRVANATQMEGNKLQRETNDKLWMAVQVHGMRINTLEGKPGGLASIGFSSER